MLVVREMIQCSRGCTFSTTQQSMTRGVVMATCRAAFAACNLLSCRQHAMLSVSKSAQHLESLQVHDISRTASTSTNIEVGFPRAAEVKPMLVLCSTRMRGGVCRGSGSCKIRLHTSSSSSPSENHSPAARGEPGVNWNLGERPTAAAAAAAVHSHESEATPAAAETTAITLQEYIALGPPRPQQQQQEQHQLRRRRRLTTRETAAEASGASPAPTLQPPPPVEGFTEGELEEWVAASIDLAASLGIDPATATEPECRRVFHLYLPVYFWLKHLLATRPLPTNPSNATPPPPPLSMHTLSPPPHISSPFFYSVYATSPDTADPPLAAAGAAAGTAAGDGVAAGAGADHPRDGEGPALVVGISAPQGCGKSTLVGEMRRMLEKGGHHCAVASIDDFYLTGKEQVSKCGKKNVLLQPAVTASWASPKTDKVSTLLV